MNTDPEHVARLWESVPFWYCIVRLGPTMTFYRCRTRHETLHVAERMKQFKTDAIATSNSRMVWRDCLELAAEHNCRPVGPVVPPS